MFQKKMEGKHNTFTDRVTGNIFYVLVMAMNLHICIPFYNTLYTTPKL